MRQAKPTTSMVLSERTNMSQCGHILIYLSPTDNEV